MTSSYRHSRIISVLTAVAVAIVGWIALPTPAKAYGADAMVLEYTVSGGQTVELPLYGTVNATIVWGDSSSNSTVTTAGFASHPYSTSGTYTIEITGSVGRYGDGTHTPNSNYWLKKVIQWGTLGFTSLTGAFRNANQLTQVPSTLPSGITDLSYLFDGASNFNGDISAWDTSAATSMKAMFSGASKFNQDISYKSASGAWNVSNVTDFSSMFYGAYSFATSSGFNQNIDNWNTGSATDMSHMFDRARGFNQPLNSWNVSKVTNMDSMFAVAEAFNKPLNSWNVGKVTNMSWMFWYAGQFDQDLSSWDVSKVTNFSYMFREASKFNGDITTWNTVAATTLAGMFQSAVLFNQDISYKAPVGAGAAAWNVSNVTDLSGTFSSALVFNQDISNWDTSKVTNMSETFNYARSFNQPVGNWNTAAVTTMSSMFRNAWAFNQPLTPAGDKWNTINVTNMSYMFSGATIFNQSVADWNTGKVINMEGMFQSTGAFDQAMTQTSGKWDTSKVTNMSYMFDAAAKFNQASITTWDTSSVNTMFAMFRSTTLFNQPLVQAAGQWSTSNVSNMGEMFNGAKVFDQDVSSWDTANNQSLYYTFAYTDAFNHSLTAWDTSKVTNVIGTFAYSKVYNQPIPTTAGHWTTAAVTSMSSTFEGAKAFNQDLTSWNTSNVTRMYRMFAFSKVYNQPLPTTTGGWTTASVTDMQEMFRGAEAFNQPLNSWDVSKVTNMALMFAESVVFNRPLDQWNTSAVTDMNQMFRNAQAFDNEVGTWDTSNVQGMYAMFSYSPFNHDISKWDTGNVTFMAQMFMGNTHFNLPIDDWDVSKVVYFFEMFRGATAFNQPIYRWTTSSATNMSYMFQNATAFDMDLSSWNTSGVTDMWEMFPGSGLWPAHYSEYLKAQAGTPTRRNNVYLKASAKYLCGAADARTSLVSTKSWYIDDAGQAECLTPQTITFSHINADGTDSFPIDKEQTLTATASSGLAVTFKWISGPCTVSDNKLTAAAGSVGKVCVIAAQQHGDATYSDAVQVLHWITVDAVAPEIATTSTIARAATSPTVVVTGSDFASGVTASDFNIGVDTTGLTLGSFTRNSATQVTFTFTGTADPGDVTIQAKKTAFDPVGSAASNTLTITVPGAPQIATTSTIARTATSPSVVITGTDFKSGLSKTDFTIGSGVTGLTISSATRDSATQVTLVFTGTAAAGDLTIQAKASAFDPSFEASNTLTITVPAAPAITTTSKITRTQTDPSVVITGTGFKAGLTDSDLTIGLGATGLTVDTVTRDSATQLTITFTGTAAVGDLTIRAKATAYVSAAEASNILTVSVPAAPVIASSSRVTVGTASPSVVVTGSGFASGLSATDFTVSVGTSGLVFATASRTSATQVTLTFTGTAALGDLTIKALATAYDAADEDSNTITLAVVAAGAGGSGGGGGGAPSLTVPSPITVPSGTTAVTALTADVTVTWSITGGADASLFTLVDGKLVFKNAPAPGTYLVEVTATDSNGNSTSKMLSITVSAGPTLDAVTNADGTVSLKVTDPAGGIATTKIIGTDKSGVSAAIVDGKVVITTATFSGTVKVEIQLTGSDGSITKKTVTMSVLPKSVNGLAVRPSSVATPTKANTLYVSSTLITWSASPNAKAYRVLVGGVEVGTTSDTKFQLSRLLAKGTKVQIIAMGGDATVGTPSNVDANGGSFIVGNSGFDNNSKILNAASQKFLNKVAALMLANGVSQVVIEGHTDNVGSAVKNRALSKARAEAVRFYLQKKVGANVTFTTIASASRKPIASNKTSSGRAANRRVDITITY